MLNEELELELESLVSKMPTMSNLKSNSSKKYLIEPNYFTILLASK